MPQTRWLCRVAAVGVFACLAWTPDGLAQQGRAPARRPVVRGAVVKSPTRATSTASTKQFKRKDATGKHEFTVTLTAGSAVDRRLLDYLERRLEIKELDPRAYADELTMSRPKAGAPGPTAEEAASEVRISMRAVSVGTDAARFVWLWPDGFDMARPGVLRVKPDFAKAIAGARDLSLTGQQETSGVLKMHPTGSQRRLRGTLQCEAKDGATTIVNPLSYIKVKIDSEEDDTDSTGSFSMEGSFGPGTYSLRVVFDGQVPVAGAGATRLVVMDYGHDAHSWSVDVPSLQASGDTILLGTITLSNVDCELWRLGVLTLDDYHQTVHKSPPAGHLRIKRWTTVSGGIPYTYYDHIVLGKDFVNQYPGKNDRADTFLHEFGHSIRHTADGNEAHWGWDNFRWAYARIHNGCDLMNVQTAFNEGWAQYWERHAGGSAPCSSMAYDPKVDAGQQPNLDWSESMIMGRLKHLAAKVTPADMVGILEANPKKIHSLWDFEKKYCAHVSLPNANCTSDHKPLRKQPAGCPPGYDDDGATCRLDNIKKKPSYGRGVGVAPKQCGTDQEYDAGLCYKECRSGYHGVGPMCWTSCPEGYKDDGATCRRDAKIIKADNSDCPGGDKCGLTYRKGCSKCPAGEGYHNDGCTCRRDAHITSKDSYGRGGGKVPKSCGANKEYDAGLCYDECRSGYHGVGPVCWGECASGYKDHGGTCYKDPQIMVKY